MANLEELVQVIERTKDEGVDLYKAEKFDEAISTWKEAAKLILNSVCIGPEALANENLSQMHHVINSNLAMAYYKTRDFSTCVIFCDKTLLRRKTMPRELLEKTLYRKASAEYELLNFEKCKDVCRDLLDEFPSNAAGHQLLRTVTRDLLEEGNDQKSMHKLDVENRKPD